MAFAKGHAKMGGRRKGIPNKTTLPLVELSQKLQVNPFEILLYFAKGDWQSLGYEKKSIIKFRYDQPFEEDVITPAQRLAAASEACQYLYPKRKAIEIEDSTERERPLAELSNEELDDL